MLGLTATLFTLVYDEDAFMSNLATDHVLRLPDGEASWCMFLEGKTLQVLSHYAVGL
ncbi:hypothetical protein K457DRAFT_142020 [Linnemannia elongata AG-77]|uniref:Uncharacterized protein n=1 Tax=Linnemannia elongata AG-77 TaxID=1314771 RepID=A0A197JH60_9FUNG|nr:hypothetical protein K457DRAFT_142020 [Linnemannia elongata AG-77]